MVIYLLRQLWWKRDKRVSKLRFSRLVLTKLFPILDAIHHDQSSKIISPQKLYGSRETDQRNFLMYFLTCIHILKEASIRKFEKFLKCSLSWSPITRIFKCTLMQVWKSVNIFIFTWKYYVEDFMLKHLLLFEIYAREIYKWFVNKHSETID